MSALHFVTGFRLLIDRVLNNKLSKHEILNKCWNKVGPLSVTTANIKLTLNHQSIVFFLRRASDQKCRDKNNFPFFINKYNYIDIV